MGQSRQGLMAHPVRPLGQGEGLAMIVQEGKVVKDH